jgi:hypothetical protein
MRLAHVVALIALVLAVATPPAGAATKPDIRVNVVSPATLLPDGSVRVDVRIRCVPTGDEPFEANITVTQDDGAAFAQPGLPFAPCDGKWHTVTATATPFDGTFHRGQAFASAFVSRIDPVTQETRQGQDVRDIQVH